RPRNHGDSHLGSIWRRSRRIPRDVSRARARNSTAVRPAGGGAGAQGAMIRATWPGRLVLLGHPVAHSLSPHFQSAALARAGISLRYEALDVPPLELA